MTRLRVVTIKEFDTIARLEIQAIDAYTKHTTAVEMTHDLEANFNEFAPFQQRSRKGTPGPCREDSRHFCDAVENAKVAEIESAVFRALTILRAATIKEFARLELAPSCCYAIA